MNQLRKDELFRHLGQFLKSRGIELTEGSYANGIQKSCELLTDAINVSQKGLQRAKTEVDRKLDQMRQVIHEKTAPKPPPVPPQPAATEAKAEAGAAAGASAAPKARKKPKAASGARKRKGTKSRQ